uniref:VRR-NUC domain-containing protein n=1 Tax=viral metagenome TaxID=1070528 RepID=A0A6M3JIW7_9ZZZZ
MPGERKNMKEKNLTTQFRTTLITECRKNNILGFYYKIPDTKGLGGMRPFDSFLLMHSKFFAFEFKVKNRKATKVQSYFLDLVKKCGGVSYMVDENNYKMIINKIISIAILIKRMGSKMLETK